MIYFDNAASSYPKPAEVLRAVTRQLQKNGANPGRSGHKMALKASGVIFSCRQTLASSFGTDPETVIFTQNTTDAVNRALKGILQPGDHVVISDLEHNSVLRPLVSLRNQGRITFDIAKTGQSDDQTVSEFLKLLRQETRLVFCTHASNVTGRILPIRQIGEECGRRGILFGVDGAQTAGIEAIDLHRDPVDFLCVPGHKGLLGPQGTGALILAKPLPMESLFEGGTGSDSLSESQPLTFPDGYESGTLNTPGIAGLNEGVKFSINHRGQIKKHEEYLRTFFTEEVRKIPGFRIVEPGERFVATVALQYQSGHSEDLARWLDRCGICTRGGYHCSALAHKSLGTTDHGATRISFGYRNTEKEVKECIQNLKKYQNYCG